MGDVCAEAAQRIGARVCALEVPSAEAFDKLAVGRKIRYTRYVAPVTAKSRLPVLFVDAHTYELHQDLLIEGFAPLFPGLDPKGYARLMLNPATREFWGGNVIFHPDTGRWGFTVEEVGSGPIGPDDVDAVWRLIQEHVDAPIEFEPSAEQLVRMDTWRALRAPVAGLAPEEDSYTVYVEGIAYGRLRRIHANDVPEDLLPTDVVVFDAAPFDLPTPIAASVTEQPHAELSHLNVRLAARGTPSCRVEDAWTRTAAFEGKLVRLECGAAGVSVGAASPEIVLAESARRRPAPVALLRVDSGSAPLANLRDIPTETEAQRTLARSRYGAKATNLATLVQRIPADWTVEGFAIPFDAYVRFARPFAEQIAADSADPAFGVDPVVRNARLASLRSAMKQAPVDPAVTRLVSDRIAALFGDTTMVRFRSSSNAEDGAQFGGAGLYESTSVCVADDRDADDEGPSRCDPDTADERGVERGLRKVWSSLWTDRAVAERLWYGIPAEDVAMAILVDPRADGEHANIVAFTGSPNGHAGDPRAFLIEAQAGELAVVSSDPGVWPEQVMLMRDPFEIRRLSASSVAWQVLSEDQLATLADRMAVIESVFPLDEPGDLVLDTEWKVLADGRIAIKQIRPFARR